MARFLEMIKDSTIIIPIFHCFKEHIKAVKDGNDYSAIFNHFKETGHKIKYVDAEIIYNCNNIIKRHLVESAIISNNLSRCRNLNKGFLGINKFLAELVEDSCFKKSPF